MFRRLVPFSALLRAVLPTLALFVAAPRVASAQSLEGRALPAPSSSATSWELGARASYLAPPIHGGSNPFGAGFGGRLGVSMQSIYIGVSVIDYLGSQDVDLSTRSLLYGAEVGYGFRVPTGNGVFFMVRPEVGAGGLTLFYTTPSTSSTPATSTTVATRANVDVITTASASAATSGSSGSSGSSSSPASDTTTTTVSSFYVQPGVTMMFSSASSFAGLKGSMLVVPGVADGVGGTSTWITYGLEADLGVRF